MKKFELNISKSFIINIVICLFLTFITLLIMLHTSVYHIDPNTQFGAVYIDDNYRATYEFGRVIREDNSNFPDDSEIFLTQLKIILTGSYDVQLAYVIFGVYLSIIYAIKYLKIKIV